MSNNINKQEKRIEILKLSGIKDVYIDKPNKKNKQHLLQQIYDLYHDCKKCGLSKTRNNFVLGEGDSDADIMFVGEGPGAEEDKLGRPFVGKAGKLFDKMLKAINLKREEVYITNVVKCRPPKNRNPKPDEIAACNPYLQKQFEIIAPKIICALGKVAGNTLLNSNDYLGKMRGKFIAYKNSLLMVTYHPSALLYQKKWKRPTWKDLQMLERKYSNLK